VNRQEFEDRFKEGAVAGAAWATKHQMITAFIAAFVIGFVVGKF
jgi:hypothetical protein